MSEVARVQRLRRLARRHDLALVRSRTTGLWSLINGRCWLVVGDVELDVIEDRLAAKASAKG